MRRLALRLFTVAAALSLFLAVGMTALVLRSYWVEDVVVRLRRDEERLVRLIDEFTLTKGHFVYLSHRSVYFDSRLYARFHSWHPLTRPGWGHVAAAPGKWQGRMGYPGSWQVLGIHYQPHNGRGTSFQDWEHTIVLPPWLLVGSGLVLPAFWLWGWWRRRFARRPGLCPRCGYDLRATPGRCPECRGDGAFNA